MERVAIVGSGIAGLGCAYFLHDRFDVTVFEAGDHIGGHSNTVTVEEDGRELPVDTGFMVYNEVTYPLLTRLLGELDVPTKPAPMSFSVQHRPSGLEWNGEGLNTLFAQRRNLLNIRHWRFLLQLDRFNKEARQALEEPAWAHMNLAEYVAARGYGEDFLERYLVPMSSAVWSTPPDKMLQFPARTLLRFWFNHGFLGLHGQHPWRTVDGGSREYVKRLVEPFEDRIHIRTPVISVERHASDVAVITGGAHRGEHRFDRLILAAHADQSLRLLKDPSPLEKELLGPFGYQQNDVDVHTDRQFMPEKRRAWASWNYRSDGAIPPDGNGRPGATTHYWMNHLQGVSDEVDYFVSLNTRSEIDPAAVRHRLQYEHPLFDLPATAAQERLPELNSDALAANHTYFCGSYFRYGFHEDAFKSAVDLCAQILEGDPWPRR